MAPHFCSLTPLTPTSSLTLNPKHQHYISLIEKKCTSIKHLKTIQTHFIKTGLINNTLFASRLISFSASRDITYALKIFSQIKKPNLFTWNTIIRAFSKSLNPQMAILLFIKMLECFDEGPDKRTYPSVFKAYAEMGLVRNGGELHGRVVKLGLQNDGYVCNSIVYMYASCGCFGEAFKVFGDGEGMDVVAWNTMIICLGKYGRVDEARELFDEMPERSCVSWNSMISGYVRTGNWVEALGLFGVMQAEKIKPSEFTVVSLLNASAQLGALKQGEWICEYIRKNEVEMNVIVVTAIINMYCKCGSVERAWEVFESAPVKGLSCWNSMIMGLAIHGRENDAIELFYRLEESDVKPDDVSFIGVLMVCSHSRLVDKAKYYFSLVKAKYKIEPLVKHCGRRIRQVRAT